MEGNICLSVELSGLEKMNPELTRTCVATFRPFGDGEHFYYDGPMPIERVLRSLGYKPFMKTFEDYESDVGLER
jgi:hypothetical protein